MSHTLDVNILDLFRTHLIVSSKVFQVIFVHLVYNSALPYFPAHKEHFFPRKM